jgi:hypothetical protein
VVVPNPEKLWQALARQHPAAARLAVISSLPVRISPAFLRLARLRLLEDCTTGNEADLWLSNLVEARSSAGFSYRPQARAFLRELLVSDPELFNRVWQEVHVHQAHWLSPQACMEEELTWRLLRDRQDRWIEDTWRTVLREMEQGANPEGVARWVVRAMEDLPPYAMDNETATKVWIAAHLLLGDTTILGDRPQRFVETGDLAFATRRLVRRPIHVGLTPRGLIVNPLRRIENGHEIDIPATRPLWIQIEDLRGQAPQVLTLSGNEPAERETDGGIWFCS